MMLVLGLLNRGTAGVIDATILGLVCVRDAFALVFGERWRTAEAYA